MDNNKDYLLFCKYQSLLNFYISLNKNKNAKDSYFCSEVRHGINKALEKIVSLKKHYLLTEDYLCYITISDDNDLYSYYTKILTHLANLLDNEKNIKELTDYYVFIFDTYDNRYSQLVKYRIFDSFRDSKKRFDTIIDVRDILKKFGKKGNYFDINSYNCYFDVIKKILFGIISYATLYQKSNNEYNIYIQKVVNNIDSFLEQLEMNDICKRTYYKDRVDTIDVDRYLTFLSNYLNNGIIDITNNKTIV